MTGEEKTPPVENGTVQYGEEYFRRVYHADLKRFSINWWSVRFYSRLCRRILRKTKNSRVLEVGCGEGHILARLEKHSRTWGVDLSEFAIERARANSPNSQMICGDITKGLPKEVACERFDLVLARYVFEHLQDPASVIDLLSDRLAPGGTLLFSVPDPASPGRRLKGDQWFAYLDETHVSLLDAERWLHLVELSGLRVVKTFSDGLWDVPYLRGIPRLVQYVLFSVPTMVSVALARPVIPAGKGENLIVIARRSSNER